MQKNIPIKSALIAVSGLELGLDEADLLKKQNPLGVSLFARNVKNKSQLKKLIEDIKNAINRDDVLIAVDQEGGRVRRLVEPEWEAYAAQIDLGKIDTKASSCHAALIARDLFELGINLNYAPVLDILYKDTTPALKSRCFSDDEKSVAKLGKAMVDEYISHGICPCIKHLPGTGRFKSDPHLGLPVLDVSLQDLQKDFYPFKKLNYAPCGMTGHFVVPWLDNKPLTQSKKAIDKLIRGEIGFEGFLISDALDMKALSGSFGEKTKEALMAGCDAVCMYSSDIKDMMDVCKNAKVLDDNSMIRFEKIKKVFENKVSNQDFNKLLVEYKKMIGVIATYKEEYDATEVLKKMHKEK